ncbi:hypothetical protein K449DRAFT_393971 [Hypoxylon sp. EC38]|nr:hypothetical protein K449DRAFT_393971 [Hypoxylon sp. EC38]
MSLGAELGGADDDDRLASTWLPRSFYRVAPKHSRSQDVTLHGITSARQFRSLEDSQPYRSIPSNARGISNPRANNPTTPVTSKAKKRFQRVLYYDVAAKQLLANQTSTPKEAGFDAAVVHVPRMPRDAHQTRTWSINLRDDPTLGRGAPSIKFRIGQDAAMSTACSASLPVADCIHGQAPISRAPRNQRKTTRARKVVVGVPRSVNGHEGAELSDKCCYF